MKNNKSRLKFVELAEKRVKKTIKAIRLVGNLSNKSNYSYTEEDVKKITKALQQEINNLKVRFESNGEHEEITFKLGSGSE